MFRFFRLMWFSMMLVIIRMLIIFRKWSARAVLVVGEAVRVDEEGSGACPNVVQLSVAVWQSPFISDSDVLWIGASTSDVGGPFRQEEMYWYIYSDLGHVELASWVAVDASPHATIIRNLPSMWWKLISRKVAHRLVDVILLLIRRNFFTSSFVALAQVNVSVTPLCRMLAKACLAVSSGSLDFSVVSWMGVAGLMCSGAARRRTVPCPIQ